MNSASLKKMEETLTRLEHSLDKFSASIDAINALVVKMDELIEAKVVADVTLNVDTDLKERYRLELEIRSMLANDETMLTSNDVLVILNISRSTYAEYVRKGMLVPRRICKKHFYLMSDLSDAIKRSKQKGFL